MGVFYDYAVLKASAELGDSEANLQWLETCHTITLAQGASASQLGKRKSDDGGVDVNGTRESLLHAVMRKTLDQERRGFLGPAMTKETLVKKTHRSGCLPSQASAPVWDTPGLQS